MANQLPLFSVFRSAWTDADGRLTQSAQIFIRELWLRTGGATGEDDTSSLVASINAAQADASEALTRSARPQSQAPTVSPGEFIEVTRDAAGYQVGVDVGSLMLAAQAFARQPERAADRADAQAVLAARIFSA